MAFIWFPLSTSNKMEPQQVHRTMEREPGRKERSTARDKVWRVWVRTSKIQLILCPWCTYHNLNIWNNYSSIQEMSENLSEPHYLGIEEYCQTSRTKGDLIILLFSSPISPGECVMWGGFLPTSTPVFGWLSSQPSLPWRHSSEGVDDDLRA